MTGTPLVKYWPDRYVGISRLTIRAERSNTLWSGLLTTPKDLPQVTTEFPVSLTDNSILTPETD